MNFFAITISFLLLVMLNIQSVGQSKYYLKEQWYTSSSPQFPVSGHPKSVKEYFYPDINTFSSSDTAKFGSYDFFTYDQSGNITERMFFLNASSWYLLKYKYTTKGYTTTLKSTLNGKVTEEVIKKFEQTEGDEFREVQPDKSGFIKRFSYKKKGNEILITEVQLGSHKFKTKIQHLYYNGQQPLKKIITDKVDTTIKTYYYSKNFTLDSIVSVAGATRNIVQFVLNEKGDPISEIQLNNNDTVNYITYSYIYDEKGNWVKRIEKEHTESALLNTRKQYALIIRKFRY